MTLGPLHAATRDLHHACEQHPVGAAMAEGSPPVEWYAAWLAALRAVHAETDPHVPVFVRRLEALDLDLTALHISVPIPEATLAYCDLLRRHSASREGATYVLTGAHLFGGELMRRRLKDYPTNHLVWPDRTAALEWFKPWRSRSELADAARTCFFALLKTMDEIINKGK